MDYSELNGGLGRMLDRLVREGDFTGDDEADDMLRSDPNAVIVGLLLDQRVLAESAFSGPLRLRQRLGHFDMRRIADMDADEFQEAFAVYPAVHRFTYTMAERVQRVARIISESYAGDASAMWADGKTRDEVESAVQQLPGFGPLKAKKISYLLHYLGYRSFDG